MGKISTRIPATSELDLSLIEHLVDMIERATGKDVSHFTTSRDPEILMIVLDEVLLALTQASQRLFFELHQSARDNVILTAKLGHALDIIDSVTSVPYDECLDHATADFMDVLISSGGVDSDADGDLVFEERTTMSKADLKPAIREAISRWLSLRIQ